jgi:hypothetical protein
VALLDRLGMDRAHFVGHSSDPMSLVFAGTRHLDRALTPWLVSATYIYDARPDADEAPITVGGRPRRAFRGGG